MVTRVFHVSASYMRRQQAKQLGWLLAMLGLVIFSLYYLGQLLGGTAGIADYLVPVLGVLACSAYAVKLGFQLKLGQAAYPNVIWDAEQETLSLMQPEDEWVLPLASLLSMRVQVGLGRVLAVTLVDESGQQLRLEGYEGLDDLIELFESRLPEGQVIRTRLRY